MTRREQLEEQYEEALFALLMDEFAVEEGKKSLQENETLKADPQAAVPEATQRRCLKTIRRRFSAKTSRAVGRATMKVVNKVAVVALFGSLLFTAAFAASSEFRISTLNFVIDAFDDYMVLHSETADDSAMPQVVTAEWLPQGYELVDFSRGRADAEAVFQTTDGKELSVYIFNGGGSSVVDTEDAEMGAAMINGYEAITVVRRGIDGYGNPINRNRVIWFDTEKEWYIDVKSSHESIETIVRVAEKLILE